MSDLLSGEKDINSSCAEGAPTACCHPADGSASACCNPQDASWNKGKLLIALIIIVAAIAVGANSFLRGNSANSYTTLPAKSFSAGLTKIPATVEENVNQSKPQKQLEVFSVNRVVDSLQALETLAVNENVIFLVLPGQAQTPPLVIPKQVGEVANNLWKSGQKVGVFTLRSGTADHNRLARQFSVKSFPSVIVLGRQGTALAVSDGITEARLYNAFVLVSKPAACNPAQCNPTTSNPSCCPK
jgi:hypothetical protein